jgi:3'(2'), 5'-bisphosphate nucleotidase
LSSHVGANEQDHRSAERIAREAGALLVRLRVDGAWTGKALGEQGDRQANERILAELREAFPDDAILSEESQGGQERLGAARTWIVDPLDGTREFTEPGRTDWAVHVALVMGGQPVAGAVALPARDLVLCAHPAVSLPPLRPGPPRLLASRTRPPAEVTQVARALGAEVIPMGSAGAKAMAVVLGDAEAYLHAGGQYEWDSAAPVAVAAAAGLHVSRLDGSPLRYNRPNPYLPDLLICRREWAEPIAAALRGTG